jgi:hypothetical protein
MIEIKEKTLKIKLNDKINEISNKDIIDLFCFISAFKITETKKGNEYDKALLKVKYTQGLMITEYINIFNIIRNPIIYEFVKYFKNVEDKYDSQNSDTKLSIDGYFSQIDNISQEIIIIMVFDIESKKEEIENIKCIIKKSIEINGMDEEIFKI